MSDSYRALPPMPRGVPVPLSSLTLLLLAEPVPSIGILYIFCLPPNKVFPSPGLALLIILPLREASLCVPLPSVE